MPQNDKKDFIANLRDREEETKQEEKAEEAEQEEEVFYEALDSPVVDLLDEE